MLRMFPKEFLKGGEEFFHVQSTVGGDVPFRRLVEHVLGAVGQFPGYNFLINRVGDHRLTGLDPNQTQITDIGQIVILKVRGAFLALKNRCDHPAHPVLPQLIRELVEMGIPTFDQPFPCL